MKSIQKPWIKLKETIDQEDYEVIHELQERCCHGDQTALKLELEYKLGAAQTVETKSGIMPINEFMYFDDRQLIGYIGLSSFGGAESQIEVNGMVHPEYRRQGVFSRLFKLAAEEWNRRDAQSVLLLSERKSEAGQSFIRETGARYDHSEYEMVLNQEQFQLLHIETSGITLRKATNEDAHEIARQNGIYFGDEPESPDALIRPEEEETKGMTIYFAEKDNEIIGKVHVQQTSHVGGIYGLGVLPEHRRNGFGRIMLTMAIQKLIEGNASSIILQVATENGNALDLYKSCGFIESSTMDYYELKK
ncbi:GNAT family N-acetyltransferase [Paenibacillus sp. CAU 1782]